ncbi:MAG TPA: hypothetical protein VJQ77_06525 [Novosphingobium sp.]|nr:hypothetical protein [Novosphingobium sp.]
MADRIEDRERLEGAGPGPGLAQGEPRMSDDQWQEPAGGTAAIAEAGASQSASVADGVDNPLFPAEDAQDLRSRWEAVQASFVDEPRRAVEDADALVAGAMKRLAETFARERSGLEEQWDRGGDVSTEDLRIALKRYRAFFGRLLAV